MMSTTFVVRDLNDRMVVKRPSIESIMLWIQENAYFEENPKQTLFLEELFTRGFEMQITPDTSLREVQDAWNGFNLFL